MSMRKIRYDIFKAKSKRLLRYTLPKELRRHGYDVIRTKKYVYGEGELPVLLVAHADTVHGTPPSKIFHDPKEEVIWSPEGLGADDRAGIWGILEILSRGYKPYVLFTDGEESGGVGAKAAAVELDIPPVNFLLELDRRGCSDAAYYHFLDKDLKEYVLRYGYVPVPGTFTDITVLSGFWEIAGINLSIGYYSAHTKAEHLYLAEFWHTVDAVCQMLEQLPKKKFEYRPLQKASRGRWYGHFWYEFPDRECDICGEYIADSEGRYFEGCFVCSDCYTLYCQSGTETEEEEEETDIDKEEPYLLPCGICGRYSGSGVFVEGCYTCLECYEAYFLDRQEES